VSAAAIRGADLLADTVLERRGGGVAGFYDQGAKPAVSTL